jgi:glycosyltransferase involved in cell wall biosynthesis
MQYVSDWNLLVAGQCNDEPIYKDLAKGLGVDDRIEWRLGFIPDDAVRYYFQAADVLILPYKPKFESQSGVLFQSYRYKLPLIVADVGSLGETVREDESGIVVPPNDPRAIAQALLDILYLDHIDWDRIEEKYHWPNIAKQVVGVYRDVIDRDGARE